ncbi:transcription termination factor 5, mitochondrial-like [Leguminivora glycinivorella]|uniref:transcription termination factor 5, mitochondrial-like n=1 Tax=Leguminivora glycinivorella TaxID=1035111 RepID=UPI00200C2D29|nr:transcription termination factor 5, mitochondrial-like [Leguminivora glycinivorella]
MIIQKFYRLGLLYRRPHTYRYFSTVSNIGSSKLCQYFDITQEQAEFICLKQPYVNKLDESTLKCLIDTVRDLGFTRKVLIKDPLLFSILPITIKFRHKVLDECGFENITPKHILSYLQIMKQTTIGQLKKSGELSTMLNVENRLASYMTQWPTSLTTLIYGDINEITMYTLRLKILQRYLELMLDLTEDEFQRGIKTYPTIKHRPLEYINETLNILQSVVKIPDKKIKGNLYLIHVDPENLKKIIYKLRSIGGVDIKDILRLHPKLATKKYEVMVETRHVLQEYGITDEAQRRCFDIYTLSPDTVRTRLEEAKTIPEFQTFLNHPRFLKMIHYKNTAMLRLRSLYNNRKKCLSLNILSGSAVQYDTFEKAPGDRLGKGKDLVFCISQCLGDMYSSAQIRNTVKRHPFWINVPLVQIKFVYQQLSRKFSVQDIYENCPILLYPWAKIKKVLDIFEVKQKPAESLYSIELLDLTKLEKSQKLSLVLYYLEKNHYFSGNGVWTEEKCKNSELSNYQYVQNHQSVNTMLK